MSKRPPCAGVFTSAVCNAPECFRRFDDVDALMAAQGQQMLAIPRDDQIGTRRDSGSNDLVVIDITDHHTRHGNGLHQLDGLDVKHLAGCDAGKVDS